MQVLASISGQYPQEEFVSDLPSVFFISLRTEVVHTLRSSVKVDKQFLAQMAQIYAELLDVAIQKLTFPPVNQWMQWNCEEQEQFES